MFELGLKVASWRSQWNWGYRIGFIVLVLEGPHIWGGQMFIFHITFWVDSIPHPFSAKELQQIPQDPGLFVPNKAIRMSSSNPGERNYQMKEQLAGSV